MINSVFSILNVFFQILKYPIYFILILFGIFIFNVFVNIIIQLSKGNKLPKNEGKKIQKRGILRRIFIDCPHQFVIDLFNKEPDFFPYQRTCNI